MADQDTDLLQALLKSLMERFPAANRIAEALKTKENRTPLFYFYPPTDPDLKNCELVVGRLGRDIEHRFGLNSEVLFLFTPYKDLQRRSFVALAERARSELRSHQAKSGNVRFVPDPDIAFIVSPDPRGPEKVHEWNLEGAASYVIPLHVVGLDATRIRQLLDREIALVLNERDLYGDRGPVVGNAFFGREQLIQRLVTGVRDGRSLGLFGLRRSGKTSVIREYRRRGIRSSQVVVLSDLEGMDGLASAANQIGEDLNEALRKLRAEDQKIFIGNETDQRVDSPSQLSARLKVVAVRNTHLRFVIALDEVESLVPFADREPEGVRAFLGALRSAAQAEENVSLLFTGVTRRLFASSTLAPGVDNPLFGFVEAAYLGPFERQESVNLIKSLGAKMRLTWEPDAAEYVHDLAGGFPFFTRTLASQVREELVAARRDPLDAMEVTRSHVDGSAGRWRRTSAEYWAGIVDALDHHHPIMATLLEASDQEIGEWLNAGPEVEGEASALAELGLFEAVGASYKPSASLLALRSLGGESSASVGAIAAAIDQARDLEELLGHGESSTTEFKSTLRWNLHTRQADEAIAHEVVKSVAAFMNSEAGGTVFIGVSDSGEVLGIEADLKLFEKSRDKFELWLLDLLGRTCNETNVARHVHCSYVQTGSKLVCRLDVAPADSPIWLPVPDPGTFYVRQGSRSKRLTGSEEYRYIRGRWHE